MCILKKDDIIILESKTYVSANTQILLAGSKNSSLVVFLNNYNLTVYINEASDITTLISIGAFIALSRLLRWGVYYIY